MYRLICFSKQTMLEAVRSSRKPQSVVCRFSSLEPSVCVQSISAQWYQMLCIRLASATLVMVRSHDTHKPISIRYVEVGMQLCMTRLASITICVEKSHYRSSCHLPGQ